MKVLVVSGIWPPDVGGPASHAPDVAAFLRSHGHGVEVVVTASAAPAPEAYPVRWVRRSLPKGAIHVRTGLEVARRAARADVVYTTGMFGRSAFGARLARRPYVIKLTADPAFERARRRGIVGGDVDDAAAAAVRRFGCFVLHATWSSGTRRMCSRPARTSASSHSPGTSIRSERPCCRIRRRGCRLCAPATSCGVRSG